MPRLLDSWQPTKAWLAGRWSSHCPLSVPCRSYGKPEARSKIAAFELVRLESGAICQSVAKLLVSGPGQTHILLQDGALIGCKRDVGRSVPDADNWRFANNRVKEVVKELVADGYTVVIFT